MPPYSFSCRRGGYLRMCGFITQAFRGLLINNAPGFTFAPGFGHLPALVAAASLCTTQVFHTR